MPRFGSNYSPGGNRWGGSGNPSHSWWRRTIAQGDNPMTWSVPLFRVAGINVRISLIYILWMVLSLASAKDVGWPFQLWSLASLFVLVLLHEFGHCFACRRVGGEADEILMWMLGGLASCRPPHNWKAALVTTIGGPGVNLLLLPVFMGVMMALGVPVASLIFNPWTKPIGTAWFDALTAMRGHVPAWLAYGLFTLHISNATLLIFNLLLVFFPFDGGRIVQELLWRKYGYTRSMWIATGIGLGGAALLVAIGLYFKDFNLMLIGGFGGFTCWQQRQQLKFIGEGAMTEERWSQWGADGEGWKVGGGGLGAPKAAKVHSPRSIEKARKAAEAERAKAESEGVELDRILAKIKDKGMASLTKSEEAFLRRSTQRSRGQD